MFPPSFIRVSAGIKASPKKINHGIQNHGNRCLGRYHAEAVWVGCSIYIASKHHLDRALKRKYHTHMTPLFLIFFDLFFDADFLGTIYKGFIKGKKINQNIWGIEGRCVYAICPLVASPFVSKCGHVVDRRYVTSC